MHSPDWRGPRTIVPCTIVCLDEDLLWKSGVAVWVLCFPFSTDAFWYLHGTGCYLLYMYFFQKSFPALALAYPRKVYLRSYLCLGECLLRQYRERGAVTPGNRWSLFKPRCGHNGVIGPRPVLPSSMRSCPSKRKFCICSLLSPQGTVPRDHQPRIPPLRSQASYKRCNSERLHCPTHCVEGVYHFLERNTASCTNSDDYSDLPR